jgi:hypothetical protein
MISANLSIQGSAHNRTKALSKNFLLLSFFRKKTFFYSLVKVLEDVEFRHFNDPDTSLHLALLTQKVI